MRPVPALRALASPFCLATALSLSLGWGIRGNFGHEYGAMIPGALAALAVCLMSGRPDWHARAAEFALLGVLGWSFGGSISYMQVVAYTHSGHSQSVLYGFACLFVIGFLWAAPGGAGPRWRRWRRAASSPTCSCRCRWSSPSGGSRAPRSRRGSSRMDTSSSGSTPTGWRRRWRSSAACWPWRSAAGSTRRPGWCCAWPSAGGPGSASWSWAWTST